MKTINLKSLIEIYKENGYIVPNQYINFIGNDYRLEIKENELNPLMQLIENLQKYDKTITLSEYNNFYLGYKIPQIGKEFDLLRFDNKTILNIEYKREISDIDKIKNQLLRNKYYLEFLNKELILIGYIQNTDKLYQLQNNEIIEISKEKFINILRNSDEHNVINLNNIFKASNYLISPFNKTKQFMEQQYFLTEQQEDIRNNIFKGINNGDRKFLIQGDAGTGKTLLVYHIAKEMMENNMNVALIHCGQLNNGQEELINNYNWNICPIKFYWTILSKKYDVLILDEVQRIQSEQFQKIKEYVNQNDIVLITSGDRKQILKSGEGTIIDQLEQQEIKKFSLTKKIRTNKELADFIYCMLDLNKVEQKKILNRDNINIVYFNTYYEANEYISSKENYSFIAYTPTLYPQNGLVGFEITCDNINTVGNPHKVIGQEFENVGVIIDKHFYYDINNKLKAKSMDNNVYSARHMLYQAVTRVIQTLEIIVVENIDIFNVLVKIFDNN